MKKATLVIWLIIFGFIALVIFQNQAFFLAKESFRINLGIFQEYLSPPIPNAIVLLIFFFSGLLIAYLFGFSFRFKAKRTIKRLNSSVSNHETEVTQLKSEINDLKGVQEPVDSKADTVKLDMNTTQQIANADSSETDADKTVKFDASSESGNPAPDNKEESEEKKE